MENRKIQFRSKACNLHLSAYPGHFVRMDVFPMNASGKVMLGELKKQAAEIIRTNPEITSTEPLRTC